MFGDNLVTTFLKLCAHNFSEKRSVWGSIAEGSADGMADCFPEGLGQGLEPGDGKPTLVQSMTAMQNSISQLAQSLHTQPPLERKGQGKGKNPKGQGKGQPTIPRGEEKPNLQLLSERATETTEKKSSAPVARLTIRPHVSLPILWAQIFFRGAPTKQPLSEEPWPGQCKTAWGGPSSSADFFLGPPLLLW